MATAQEILDDAVGRSSLNDAAHVNTTSILRTISRYERRAFLYAAKHNPEYFGKTGDTITRSAVTSAWDVTIAPGDVAALLGATVAAIEGTVTGVNVGTLVNFISGRTWGPSGAALALSPRAYYRGRKIVQYGTELGTDGTNLVTKLTLFYAELPPLLTSMTHTLRLPDEWGDLVILPVARLLALKDRRLDEAGDLKDEYVETFGLFMESVQVHDGATLRPLESVPVPTTGGIVRGE